MGYVTLCIEALTFHVPGVFETKCEAAPALGEHITLDDPFAEMTAPAEAGNIVKGDEVSPDPTDLQDVFVCTVLFFLDSGYSIRFLIVFFVSAFGHFWPAVFSQGTLVAQLVYCKPVPVRDHISKSFPWQVPESATQDDVAEQPVKSPEACEQLWTYLYPDVSRHILGDCEREP